MFLPQILCVFGRGIEKVNGVWQPTHYIEKVTDDWQHPGVRVPDISWNDDDPRILIAGSEVNAVATALYFKQLSEKRCCPEAVIFASGRPKYIQNDPDQTLTEGRVLQNLFLKTVNHGGATMQIQDKNRNSRDDVIQTLQFAHQNKG